MNLVLRLFSGALVGAMAAVLTISFTAIVFSGPMATFLDRGIGLSLIAAALMAASGGVFFSYRGTINQPQDITAILLAGAGSSIFAAAATSGVGFATVLALLMLSAMLTGVVLIIVGRARLSFVAKFVPYPVLGGFLASTGYLLLFGAIGLLLDRSVSIWDLPELLGGGTLSGWGGWIVMSFGIVVLTRRIKHDLTLPICILGTVALYYGWLMVSGTTLAEAKASGAFLGPFGHDGFLTGFDPATVLSADLALLRGEVVTIFAVVAMATLGAALNLSGVALDTGQKLDLDRDMQTTGLGNLLAAPTGGLLGFPAISDSLLTYRLGIRDATGGLMTALTCLGIAIYGAALLEYIPRGLFAVVIGFLGADLLYTWLWTERRRLMGRDFAIVALTLIVAASFGFLEALAIGLVAAALLFVVSYAGQSILRLQSDASFRTSLVERGMAAQARLAETGRAVRIVELTGYIFFGTAQQLLDTVEATLAATSPKPERLLLDFARVQGIDPSATHSLYLVRQLCDDAGVELTISGLTAHDRAKIARFAGMGVGGGGAVGHQEHDTLDAALQEIEAELLRGVDDAGDGFHHALLAAAPGVDLDAMFEEIHAPRGTAIVTAGSASDELFILLSGTADAVAPSVDGIETDVAISRMLPGALIGEIGFYTGAPRSATVRAQGDARLLRINRARLAELEESHGPFVAAFHRLAATYVARRLDRSTRLLVTSLS